MAIKEPLPLPQLIAPLAPQHTGFTVTSQPTLYWYMDAPWDANMEFSINEVRAIEPSLELVLGLPPTSDVHKAGMHHLRLADFDFHLKKDQEYEWFVFITPDPEQRSADLMASGTIRYMEPSPQLTQRLNQTPKEQWYQTYAEQGIWYDAIDQLCQQIDQNPGNQDLRRIRAVLNKEVAMPKVADYDQKAL
ncbi:protein containing DUF928 [Beggiatoa sp. PS]|nr:protein containing DUF928 [Beggiatoa sp. PS]